MSEIIDKKRDLLSWIKDYEKKIEEKYIESDDERKNIFQNVYEKNDKIRKFFFDDYLNNISNNLNI